LEALGAPNFDPTKTSVRLADESRSNFKELLRAHFGVLYNVATGHGGGPNRTAPMPKIRSSSAGRIVNSHRQEIHDDRNPLPIKEVPLHSGGDGLARSAEAFHEPKTKLRSY
jgi:hypothetical protein